MSTWFVPRWIRRRILSRARDIIRMNREEADAALPRVALSREHVECCRLLPDREALLQDLAKGGTVAEIGVFRGDFSAMILDVSSPSELHLVDSWDPSMVDPGMADRVSDRFADEIAGGTVHIHRKSSVEAAADFPDSFFDWVYIDSDHTYSTTRDELAAYAGKVKEGGMIAGHDYSMGNWASGFRYGVIEAVHEFCAGKGWKLVFLTADPREKQSFAITRIR